MRYRRKATEIEAEQFTGGYESINKIQEFIGKQLNPKDFTSSGMKKIILDTIDGAITINCYDYIIKSKNGNFYLCKPDSFEKFYEKIDEK